jgi:predicted nucleotide-binding protein
MTKFFGAIEDLKGVVAGLGFEGEWEFLAGDKHQFTTIDGAVLNWWTKTRTVQFQGATNVRTPFEKRVSEALTNWKQPAKGNSPIESIPPPPQKPSNSENKRVFIVHGHDDVAREQLELILHRLGLDPFVLANTGGGGLTLIEALENEIGPDADSCRFGIVLMTPDDIGYAKKEGDGKAAPRARQNVVMEMGMLISALKRQNVAILKKGHIEVPSDAHGIIYIPFNDHVRETAPKLVDRLNHAGFNLGSNAITRATS